MRRFAVVLIAACLCLVPAMRAQRSGGDPPIDTSIVQLEGRTTWAPGVQGGIPPRPTSCGIIWANDFGNGTKEASVAINRAIAACPAGQTLNLSVGTFLVNDYIMLNKGITLRGAGPGATKLMKTNGARWFDYHADDPEPIIVMGPTRWPKIDDSTSVDLAADAVKGAMSVTVRDASQFRPGQFVLLDEDDYNTASWLPLPRRMGATTNSTIWGTDRVVFNKHNPPEESGDDPFPASLTWFSRSGRPLSEIKEVVAVERDTVAFSTPIHTAYTKNRQAQLTRFVGESVHLRDAGIEDLTVSGGADGNIRVQASAYSWVKNVESTFWAGAGVGIDQSFRVELRDSIIHDTAWPQPGGAGYAISLAFGSSEILIENNAVLNVNKVMVVRSSGAGSVVGYNYMDNGYILNLPEWVEVGINASHQVGSHHVLFEGNQAFNYDSDNTHGNAIAMTVFRNHLVGRRASFTGMQNARGAGLMFGSWWHSFIGNVIGEPDRMAGWIYEDPGDHTYGHATSQWGDASFIWKLGYDPGHWAQAYDPKVRSTTLRDGNFDYLTNEVRWDRKEQRIPDSLYLRAKPAFFGSREWPWVNPTGVKKLGVLPARERDGIGAPMTVLSAPKAFRIQQQND